jgi:glycosyltransferase involved in cell wall biosynthesis
MRKTDPRKPAAMKRLTVLQMLPALASGGVERGTLEVGKYLVEHGHRSIVMSAGGCLVQQLEREGSEHVAWSVGHKSLLTPLRYVWKLRRFLLDEKVDILHIRSRMPGWVAYLAWKGMNSATRPHLVSTVHGLYSRNVYSAVMTKGERVIAVSETVRSYIHDNYPRTPMAHVRVIPRGIEPDLYPRNFQPTPEWLAVWRQSHPQLIGKKVLTLPGRITRLKGHEDFIDLIARLKAIGEPVHGLIVGGAEQKKQRYLDELHSKVNQLGLTTDITFTGQRGDMREIMSASDIVLSLSTKPESFGRTVLEALSMGVPVIGYDHGGVGEQLARFFPQGRAGLGNMDALVRQSRAIQADTRIEPCNALPTLQDMLKDTLSVYEECLGISNQGRTEISTPTTT